MNTIMMFVMNKSPHTMPHNLSAILRRRSVSAALLLIALATIPGGRVSAAAGEAEARAFFAKFVAAQNAHDVSDVKAMLWNSPDMLWYGRGVETRGPDAVADRFREYYQGTWHLEPDMSQFRATAISDDVMQILVPIVFTRGLPGQPSRDNKFLISQTLIHDANGWHVASIMPIANTQLK
ncbi:nuclear transport factor 2 family protein [Bradyrhizobium sp. 2S1]|uniref:nuclear transport factor 2 family protein n=1 Tax=Bradyrhizobium sp. 2S1 TaxID=1404429 RepID=UPI0030CAE900